MAANKTLSRWLLYPDDWATPDITMIWRESQPIWPQTVKCRALLVLHADLQQGGFPQGATRQLQAGWQSGLSRSVHHEEPGHPAEIGGSADIGSTGKCRIRLVERPIDGPSHGGQRWS